MFSLSDIRIRTKLFGGFGAVLIILLAVGLLGTRSIGQVNDKSQEIIRDWLPSVEALGAMRQNATLVRQAEYRHVLSPDAAEMARAEREIEQAQRDFAASSKTFEELLSTPEERASFKEVSGLWEQYLAESRKAQALSRDNQDEQASQVIVGSRALYDQFTGKLAGLSELNMKGAADASGQAAVIYRSVSVTSNVLLVIGLAAGLLLAWVITRAITAPVSQLVKAAQRIAVGDIDQSVEHRGADELGQLADSFRALIEYVRGIAAAADAVGRGDLSAEVRLRSDRDRLSRNMAGTIDTLRRLVDATRDLTEGARAGDLRRRGEPSRFDGAYREVVAGLNDTLDAVVAPIAESLAVLERVAARDLSVRVEGDYVGEHARLKEAVNAAIENLATALGAVDAASQQVSSASNQISSGSQVLAEGSSEQTASLEEVASSLAELAAMAEQTAGNAREATQLGTEAHDAVEAGAVHMNRLSEAIAQIESSSNQTAKIVKSIDEIAFQTNLLALNAAVEAARAGDAGRGFAVVADEVRALAVRAAEASRQTAALIEEGGRHARTGVEVNGHALSGLHQVVATIGKVRDVITSIAAASEQQRDGVAQINRAVEQMNGVTQAVAANAEESAAAAEELNGQATTLGAMVGQFALGTARKATVRVAAAAAPRASVAPPARDRGSRRAHTVARAAGAVPAIMPDEEEDAIALASF